MGATFDRWLTRPTTICFFHRLLSVLEKPAIRPSDASFNSISNTQKRRLRSLANAGAPSERYRIAEAGCSKRKQKLRHHGSSSSARHKFQRGTSPKYQGVALRLLDYEEGEVGFEGVRHEWQKLRENGIDLPTIGKEADAIWTAFIRACIERNRETLVREFHDELIEYAKDLKARCGVQYEPFVLRIVGCWIRTKPELARQWYKNLTQDFDAPKELLRMLADDFFASNDVDEARKCFRRIHRLRQEHHLYDHYMSRLYSSNDGSKALLWHQTLLEVGETPSETFSTLPEIQKLMKLDTGAIPSLSVRQTKTSDPVRPGTINVSEQLPWSRATMSTLVGDAHGIAQKEVSDDFIARIFATKTFSLDLLVRGMSFFGINTLKAASLRELGLRVESASEFCEKLEQLKASGIHPDNSMYSRLIQQLAHDDEPALFKALLARDQHPDEYNNVGLQTSLLEFYLRREQWADVHINLLCLSNDPSKLKDAGWNQLLQHHTSSRDERSVLRIMDHMRSSGIRIFWRTLNLMHRSILPRRSPSKRPGFLSDGFHVLRPLEFMITASTYAARSGTYVEPYVWQELLKRQAAADNWRQFEILAIWILRWYSGQTKSKVINKRGMQIQRPGILQEIFSIQMRKAMVAWGIRSAVTVDGFRESEFREMFQPDNQTPELQDKCEPWARGLLLLKIMNDMGLATDPSAIRNAFVTCLWKIFGPAYSTLRVNELIKQVNQTSLSRYVQHANEIWKGKLFNVHQTLLEENSNDLLHIYVFGHARRVSRRRREYANVVLFARDLPKHSTRAQPQLSGHKYFRPIMTRSVRSKALQWRRSPYRLVKSG